MTAPGPSPAERARLDEFEARPAAEEACVERVARAIWETDAPGSRSYGWDFIDEATQVRYRRLAVAAINAMRPENAALVCRQAAALAAVETVAVEYEAIFNNRRLSGAHRSTCLGVAQRIRAALAEQEAS